MVTNARSALARFLPAGGVLLSVLLFGNYAMGQLRDRIFAQTFGAGGELDAYNAAFVLPELLLDVLVASGLAAPFIPIFLQLRGEEAGAGQSVRPDDPDRRRAGDDRRVGRPVRVRAADDGIHRARLHRRPRSSRSSTPTSSG